MKFTPFFFVIFSLLFLSSCGQDDDQVVPTPVASVPDYTSTNSFSSNQSQGRQHGRHHEIIRSEVISISTGTTSVNSDGGKMMSKKVSYLTPSGTITTDFTLVTDAGGTITKLDAVYIGNDHEDLMYHHRFNSSASKQIVGKKIQDISLDVIAGASLTTDAFNKMISSL